MEAVKTEVTDTAQEVIDDIIAGMGVFGSIASLVASLLTVFGTSTTTILAVVNAIAALQAFLTKWESTIVSWCGTGEEVFNDLVTYISELESYFSAAEKSAKKPTIAEQRAAVARALAVALNKKAVRLAAIPGKGQEQ